jgi:hypothetical protein
MSILWSGIAFLHSVQIYPEVSAFSSNVYQDRQKLRLNQETTKEECSIMYFTRYYVKWSCNQILSYVGSDKNNNMPYSTCLMQKIQNLLNTFWFIDATILYCQYNEDRLYTLAWSLSSRKWIIPAPLSLFPLICISVFPAQHYGLSYFWYYRHKVPWIG